MSYSELEALGRFSDLITVEQFGRDCFIRNVPTEQDIQAAQQGLAQVREIVTTGHWDVVILDEATIATQFGLFTVDELLDLIDAKPESMEIVITGRHADARLMARADLVTEMREVKHYYAAGVWARPGIEN
jgi:cob(I)alamin adenosyltransferase